MRHQRKILRHTAVPAAIALRALLSLLIITDIVAMTGRAHIGTSTAGQAACSHLLPDFAVEYLQLILSQLVIYLEIMQRQYAQNFLRLLLLLADRCRSICSCLRQHTAIDKLRCQLLALGSHSLPAKLLACQPGLHIRLRSTCVNAKGMAEAGFFGSTAA